MVRQTRNIPQDKLPLVSDEEKQQAYDYHNNTDGSYHAGINVGKEGFYDPEAGAGKHPIYRPESVPTPVLATDPGQPKGIGSNLVQRERNKAVDKSEIGVVRSSLSASPKATGRKPRTQENADAGTGELS